MLSQPVADSCSWCSGPRVEETTSEVLVAFVCSPVLANTALCAPSYLLGLLAKIKCSICSY